jgi:hypothetical protein
MSFNQSIKARCRCTARSFFLVLQAAITPRFLHVAELANRFALRLAGRHASRHQLLDPHREMTAQLLVAQQHRLERARVAPPICRLFG